MDLKSKRIVSIAQLIFLAGMLVLYTGIGGMGMIYVAGSMEVFLLITGLFLGGIPDAMEYMIRIRRRREQYKDAANVWKAGVAYGVLATILAEAALVLINNCIVIRTDLLYVDKLLSLLMITVPFLAVLQVIRGVLQAEFDRLIIGISRLVFVVCMVIGTVSSAVILGDYGEKVARLVQSVRLKHFYVLLGLVPGILLGALGAIAFLLIMGILHKRDITILDKQPGVAGEGIFKLTVQLFAGQLTESVGDCLKHVPVLVLLWLSLEEIAGENYLFGNFYGAILPVFGLVWILCDLGLVTYKRRLFVAYRKKQTEQYYRDLKTVLCYVILHSVAIMAFAFALHKSYLAIWSLQTFTSFMNLAALSAVLGFLGLPCMVFLDILKYRGLRGQAVAAMTAGTMVSVITALICMKALGAGSILYVLSIGLGLAVTMLLAAFLLSRVVGINYVSVLIRTGCCIVITLIIAIILFGVQTLIFTAFGGLATLIMCLLLGILLQFISILAMRVYDKEELNNLPPAFLNKFLTRFF